MSEPAPAYLPSRPSQRWHMRGELTRDGARKRCAMCRRWLPLQEFRRWGGKPNSYCRPCWVDYIGFRWAFRREHGRWPTMKEFLDG